MMDKTTIALSRDLVARLSKLGKKGESYEVIIERLLDEAKRRVRK